MKKEILIWCIIGIMLTGAGKSKTPALDDPLLKADFGSESVSGGTNAVTALGNGRLSVGVSPWSELIYFRWPRPSFYDHLRYITITYSLVSGLNPKDVRYSDDAPSIDWMRYGRPYERYPGLGAKGGIYFKDGSLSWFGDPRWQSSRAYEPEWGPVLCTTLQHNAQKEQGQARVCQWVDWEYDLLVQEFTLNFESAEKFFYYGTFAPYDGFGPLWGEPDPKDAGFATIYLPSNKIILYFYPKLVDKNKATQRILAVINQELTPEIIDQIYPEGGYFIAMALMTEPDGFQVGADFRGIKTKKSDPPAASEDAKDGFLSGSKFFLGKADAGFQKNMSTHESRITVLISAGKSAKDAANIIDHARFLGEDLLRKKVITDWQKLVKRVKLPEQATLEEKRVARRNILNLFIGRDRESGAIVASPSRQPAYHFDWPRDGSFYDLSLDLAGFSEIALSHLDFYRRTQRKEDKDSSVLWLLGGKSTSYCPKGHWYSNIYTDGSPGKLKVIPIEIDETALLLWDLWRHEQFVPVSERAQYQKQFTEMLILGADGLLEYVDTKNGWTKKVFEDDNYMPSATLHGASSILAGLASAIDLGTRWGVEPEKVAKWRQAAVSLRNGMLKRINDDKTLEAGGWRGIQWSLFPAPLFESYDDPRAKKLIQKLAKQVEEEAMKKRPGFAYLGEKVFILAIATKDQPEYKPLLENALKILVNEVPMPGADCFGEVTLWITLPGESAPVAQQRTSIPHLWTGTTAYLSVIAFYQPEKFLTQIPPIPK